MLGVKKRETMMMGSKLRGNPQMLGSAKMQNKNPLSINTGTNTAEQKSSLERLTKTGQNFGSIYV